MQSLQIFAWASGALILSELVEVHLAMRQAERLAKCWGTHRYWLLVVLIAAGAGFFAIAMDVQTKINAMFVGMACPFIIRRFLDEQKAGKP